MEQILNKIKELHMLMLRMDHSYSVEQAQVKLDEFEMWMKKYRENFYNPSDSSKRV